MNRLAVILCAVLWLGEVPAAPPAAPGRSEVRRVTHRGVSVDVTGASRAVLPDLVRVIEDQLRLAGDSTVSAPLADDLAFFSRGMFLQFGHAAADVTWAVHSDRIDLTVEEGPRWTVGAVRFSGADDMPRPELQAFLLRQTREREGVLRRSLPYVEADVRAGAELVTRHLQASGYLEAVVEVPPPDLPPNGGTVDIEVVLAPGVRSLIGNVTLAGDTGPLRPEARARAAALTGQPYNEVAIEEARGALRGGLQTDGHFAAEVTAVSDASQGASIPVTFTVVPGARYAVRAVPIDEALGRGARRVAESVFSTAAGETFDPEGLDLLHRRALDTGIFSQLEVEPTVVGEGLLDLRVSGTEARPKTLGYYGGYESLLGAILGMEFRNVNFRDTGNAAAVRLELRGTGGEGAVQFTDPAIFGSAWALSTGVSYEKFTFADYERQTAAWRSALTRRFSRRVTAELFSSLSYNEMDTDVLTPDELGPGKYGTASGGLRLTFDFRDNPLLARDGWMVSMSGEGGAIHGDDSSPSFVRSELSAGWYQPLTDRWRVSLGARGRLLFTPAEVEDIPIDLRIFNGGASSVRSFTERDMGSKSKDGDTPLGGLAAGVVSAELSYEVVRNLELAVFGDAGTLGEERRSFLRGDDLRYAIGLGLRSRLPVGPLRIHYGVNPDRLEGESFGALHITFGFAF